MTKVMLCTECFDIIAPFRDHTWRDCACGVSSVKWINGNAGTLAVSSRYGSVAVRVIGLDNYFLVSGITEPPPDGQGWRDLHDDETANVAPRYLFHEDNRKCWALIVRVGESGDVTFVPWIERHHQEEVNAAQDHTTSPEPSQGQQAGESGGSPGS